VSGRNSSAFAAAGAVGFASAGNSIFFPLADGRRELQQASQRPYQRRGTLIFESTRPIGTKIITDKNLLSCGIADCVTDSQPSFAPRI
jgi:hypothetical protein